MAREILQCFKDLKNLCSSARIFCLEKLHFRGKELEVNMGWAFLNLDLFSFVLNVKKNQVYFQHIFGTFEVFEKFYKKFWSF